MVLATLLFAAALFTLLDAAAAARAALRRAGGARPAAFAALRGLPGVAALVAAAQAKVLRELDSKASGVGRQQRRDALPRHGAAAADVLDLALDMAAEKDAEWTPGESQMSGAGALATRHARETPMPRAHAVRCPPLRLRQPLPRAQAACTWRTWSTTSCSTASVRAPRGSAALRPTPLLGCARARR